MFKTINTVHAFAAWALMPLFAALSPTHLHAQEPVRLIAHRGGVVDEHHLEDSWAAAETAIKQGYWMLEIDLQETNNGRIVVHHGDFLEGFGVRKIPAQMTMAEIGQLRSPEKDSRPLEFSELAARCKGKIQLMIDTKPPHHPKSFYESMERTLRKNGLLKSTLFIGTSEAQDYFKGKARVGIGERDLAAKIAAGEDISQIYFLFEHGTTLNEQGIALAKKAGIPAVASVNEYHYAGNPDPMAAAHADIDRLRRQGVTYFQIDSSFADWLR